MSQNYPTEGEICECGGIWRYDPDYENEDNPYEEHYVCDKCGQEAYYD